MIFGKGYDTTLKLLNEMNPNKLNNFLINIPETMRLDASLDIQLSKNKGKTISGGGHGINTNGQPTKYRYEIDPKDERLTITMDISSKDGKYASFTIYPMYRNVDMNNLATYLVKDKTNGTVDEYTWSSTPSVGKLAKLSSSHTTYIPDTDKIDVIGGDKQSKIVTVDFDADERSKSNLLPLNFTPDYKDREREI